MIQFFLLSWKTLIFFFFVIIFPSFSEASFYKLSGFNWVFYITLISTFSMSTILLVINYIPCPNVYFFHWIQFHLYIAVFSKPGFRNTWTVNIQMFKLVLVKAEESEIKLPTSAGSSKKQENSTKTSISALLTMPKPLTVWITINCGKFWKRWEYQTIWSASWEICMQVRKQQLELDMEQQTGSK